MDYAAKMWTYLFEREPALLEQVDISEVAPEAREDAVVERAENV